MRVAHKIRVERRITCPCDIAGPHRQDVGLSQNWDFRDGDVDGFACDGVRRPPDRHSKGADHRVQGAIRSAATHAPRPESHCGDGEHTQHHRESKCVTASESEGEQERERERESTRNSAIIILGIVGTDIVPSFREHRVERVSGQALASSPCCHWCLSVLSLLSRGAYVMSAESVPARAESGAGIGCTCTRCPCSATSSWGSLAG